VNFLFPAQVFVRAYNNPYDRLERMVSSYAHPQRPRRWPRNEAAHFGKALVASPDYASNPFTSHGQIDIRPENPGLVNRRRHRNAVIVYCLPGVSNLDGGGSLILGFIQNQDGYILGLQGISQRFGLSRRQTAGG